MSVLPRRLSWRAVVLVAVLLALAASLLAPSSAARAEDPAPAAQHTQEDGGLVARAAAVDPAGEAAITQLALTHQQSGSISGPLGPVACGLVDGGCYQEFSTGGPIVWSPATGAHAFTDDRLADGWFDRDGEGGPLGYPTRDTVCGLFRGGCFSVFEGGALYAVGGRAHALAQPGIWARWAQLGWEGGKLGYPVGDALCGLRGGGCFQSFEKGALYWSAASGARPMGCSGQQCHYGMTYLWERWAQLGWEAGTLGYPTTDPVCGLRNGGCYQVFQGGALYWSDSTGARLVYGGFWTRWAQLGWEGGQLGYPTGDPICGLRHGGCFQAFEYGSIYGTAFTGTSVVNAGMRHRWAQLGWENGVLGYPKGNTTCGLRFDGCFQLFEGGALYSAMGSGTRMVRGEIWARWAQLGWENGPLRYPTGDVTCGLRNGGCFQTFSGSSLYWSPSTGARIMEGRIKDEWAARGWENGHLGYPVEDPRAISGGVEQRFQGGTMTLNRRGITVS